MSSGISCKSFDLVRHPAAEASTDGANVIVYVLLPTVEELLGQPDFARRNPIFLPGHRRPLDGWAMFGPVRNRGLVLH
jgi:hypothetical protein